MIHIRSILLMLSISTTIAVGADAWAQASPDDLVLDEFLEDTTSLRQSVVPMFLLVTILSLAPGLAMMVTCFPFMAIVFSFLRQAIGLQHAPPAMMLTSLALFLTYFVMEPVFSEAWQAGVRPYLDGEIDEAGSFAAIAAPIAQFMESRVNPDTVARLASAASIDLGPDGSTEMRVLIPAFMLSEITRAFQIGFAIFMPFLVIDLVVASVLMAMGMMMVPPAVVSLPFKLAFFVVADGWAKISEALVRGYLQ